MHPDFSAAVSNEPLLRESLAQADIVPMLMVTVQLTGDMALLDEGETTCCYARSEKHWITDPQGVAWEHFHTLGDIPVFSEAAQPATGAACCAPARSKAPT